MMRRMRLLLGVALLIALLTSCATGQPGEPEDGDISRFNTLNEEEPDVNPNSEDQSDEPRMLGVQEGHQTSINLYFYDEAASQLSPETRVISGQQSSKNLIEYVLNELIDGPESAGLEPILPKVVQINRLELFESILTVDLTSSFYQSEDLSLARAALVNTLLDLGSAKYIRLHIDGNEATLSPDEQGGILGLLTMYPTTPTEIEALEAQDFGMDEATIYRELYFQDNAGQYLLPEVRRITVTNGNYAETIVNEMLKGPVAAGEGYYPTLPKGTVLDKIEAINHEDDTTGVSLYFSKEFYKNFTGGSDQEVIMISSVLYSLSTLPDIDFVNIYYDNGKGEYVSKAIAEIDYQGLTMDNFPNKVGKRIRVYFGDEQGMLLIPEYRAISRTEKDMVLRMLTELAKDPMRPGSVRVIPPYISTKDVQVEVHDHLAIVDVPTSYFNEMELDNKRIIRDLYAVVNSLTDPVNSSSIHEVQFTVEGKLIDSYMGISLKESFVMNPALIKGE